ncbi:DUF2382 domain-containing protein [Microcoleus sp. FACHB-68]|uniref:DUF2382 domain-containing protein n=1 Tax=Microcoleus sp. FACHB-68 TaxID=2692826 RepID=UPI00168725E1|nr:DUF2382 domain-containing protein [Microcoleus sp. FACHB-68]MBD1938180.1 DUF2382 domain-containing protein [Microcoleus sp. FACHB-68]
MPLYKLEDFNPNYREQAFDGEDIKGLDVYAGSSEERIGKIYDALVDEMGRFRYLVIDTGFWIFGKKVLLPVGRCRVDVNAQRVYAMGLVSKEQAEHLPEYDESMTVDYAYEERVRGVYRTPSVEGSLPVETSAPVEAPRVRPVATPVTSGQTVANPFGSAPDEAELYNYDREPTLYEMNERDHQKLRLYEERLVANKSRHRAGAVEIGKHVETQVARAAVPVEKDRVVIERTQVNPGQSVRPGSVDFHEGEVARVELYEEVANIKKQAFVREEVNIRKETEQEIVQVEEVLRREELDVHTEGHPVIERNNQPRTDR